MSSINDEYEKLQILGKGSFATIWKVRHRKYGYIRTLKILNTPVQDENDHAYQQFVKECTVLLNIGNGSNNNIVHIYQPRLIDNRAVVEMDFIDGETLDQYLRRNKFIPIDEVMRFISEIGGALAYCHHDIYKYMMNPNEDDLKSDPDDGRRYIIDEATKQRLVRKYAVTHNDLHSNNVMRRENDGSYVLLDFGLAIQNGTAVKSSALRGGALEYMAPEKFDDNSVITTQSDMYSFGILMYEVLAGRVPFELGSNASFSDQTRLYQMHKTGMPPEIEPLRREAFEAANPGQAYVKDYPDWLEAMIKKCLEKNPADRYADAKELMNEFYSNRRVFVDENSLSERVNTQLDNNNYDVFISFSTQDSVIVDKICNYLEKNGLRCFVCTMDIPKSVVWAEAITEAIENCKMFLAVFSKHFDDSKQTDRELELASEAALPIICCRITNDEMTGATKYYLKNINWIDAYSDTEAGFCKILAEIQRLKGENIVKDNKYPTDTSLVPCPDCGKMINGDALFCQYCGFHLHSSDGNKQVKCNGCGNLISSDDKECPYCGYPDCTLVLCHGCGKWVSARLDNCPHCGIPMRKTTTPPIPPAPPKDDKTKQKSKKSIGWLIGGIVALVIVVIALVTIFVREHKAAMVTDIFMRLNEQEQIIKSCGDIVIVPNGTPTNDFEQIAYKLKNCEEVQVEERNTMTVMVNSDNNILVNGEPINISELNTKVKDFLGNPNNNPDLSDKEVKSIPELGDYFVSKGVIFLQKKGNVDSNFCRNVEFELEHAIYEMRVELSYNIFNTYFSILEDEKQSMAIREAIPLAIIK